MVINKEIYYVFTIPFLSIYYHRFALDYLIDHGWKVKLLEVSPIVHPLQYAEVTTGLSAQVDKKIFTTKADYCKYVRAIKRPALFIFTEDFNYDNSFTYAPLRKEHRYGYLGRQDTCFPSYYTAHRRAALKVYLKNVSINKIFRSIYVRIPRMFFRFKRADFLILGGRYNSELYIHNAYTGKRTKIIYLHSFDYEIYLDTLKDDTLLVEGRYWVFIDQYIPYHSDAKEIKGLDKIDPNLYYEELRRFFKFVERKYNTKVVIAAHPRSDYNKHPEAYEGFQVFRFATNELIKNCDVVLSHFSTSDSFAALYSKPILYVSTTCINELEILGKARDIHMEVMGGKNIDVTSNDYESVDLLSMCEVDKSRYIEVIRNLLKADYDGSEKDYESFYPQFERILNDVMA